MTTTAQYDLLDLAALTAAAREITDAEIDAHRTAIAAGDTVRYPGKRTNWIVGGVHGDTAEVYTFCGRGARTYRSHRVALDRIELVRKGNRIDDGIARLDDDLRAMGYDPEPVRLHG